MRLSFLQMSQGSSKRVVQTMGTALLALWLSPGCYDQVAMDSGTCADELCEGEGIQDQVPAQESIPRSQLGEVVPGLDALDVLLVVDNSASMAEEQQTLATSIYNLVMSVANPAPGSGIGRPVSDVRVAVATTDLGLQYGGHPGPSGLALGGCREQGDNGSLSQYGPDLIVELQAGVIECAPEGSQCPTGWSCDAGRCSPEPGGTVAFTCPAVSGLFASSDEVGIGFDLALRAACLAQVGTTGCGFEQQLEASLVTLAHHPELVRDNALLAVIVVSDEEDCSVADNGLFETNEFSDPLSVNMACNYPARNEEFLYPTSRFREELVALKGNPDAVVFAAFAGVPTPFEASCKGLGTWLDGCLDQPAMQLEPMVFSDELVGTSYRHFRPSCVRDDDPGDDRIETEARPGRRFVQVAQDFGQNGYMASICDRTWKVSMQQVERMIAARLGVLAQ
ncbi:MAG: hypothetical protein MUC50_13730 [Myxococcota bacterium]|nr:hypothetical protein [Myxococcota bacterium]